MATIQEKEVVCFLFSFSLFLSFFPVGQKVNIYIVSLDFFPFLFRFGKRKKKMGRGKEREFVNDRGLSLRLVSMISSESPLQQKSSDSDQGLPDCFCLDVAKNLKSIHSQ